MFTTILPHLASHKIHEFRYAFFAGVVALGVLCATGFILGAILVAAILIPTLYTIYLYEAQVYRDEPTAVLALTIAAGAALGIIVTIVATKLNQPGVTSRGYVNGSDQFIATVIIPVIQLIAIAAPPMLLRRKPVYADTTDGLVFGVAAGLGFAAAESIVRFSSSIADLPLRTDSANWVFPLLTICVFVPLLHASAGGLVTASLWTRRRGARTRPFALAGAAVAIAGSIAFYVGDQLLADNRANKLIQLGWQALAVMGMIIFVRYLLHHALLDEAVGMGLEPKICANCHKHVVAAGFCPACGMALSASPRRSQTVPAPAPAVKAEGR